MERSCHANKLNLPESKQKGMIEIVMANNFGLCSTRVEEEKIDSHNSFFHYSNTIWHKNDNITNGKYPREEFIAWKCSYGSRYHITPDCKNETHPEECQKIPEDHLSGFNLSSSHSKNLSSIRIDRENKVDLETDLSLYLTNEDMFNSLRIYGKAYSSPTFEFEDQLVKYDYFGGSEPFYVLDKNNPWTSLQEWDKNKRV
ncbi:Oidioi.mRNA.OKI2018_I69.chr2.g4237.t1.cds [Oikopleura dioica]|uniref:Oidioi.mRNA.OKI2018_I69.chr2.g4237.t1.cds n=1 Tax=Oikopleura dioica TaxID=34765 RepID=A0ABN7T255_OIKDI|nr:Oidioi.mRNA.OKI2018_I69.chr2.g4237.t1.cds [Oikopleura dioica]